MIQKYLIVMFFLLLAACKLNASISFKNSSKSGLIIAYEQKDLSERTIIVHGQESPNNMCPSPFKLPFKALDKAIYLKPYDKKNHHISYTKGPLYIFTSHLNKPYYNMEYKLVINDWEKEIILDTKDLKRITSISKLQKLLICHKKKCINIKAQTYLQISSCGPSEPQEYPN